MSPRRPSEEEREASFFFFRIPARKPNLQQGAERFLGPRVAEGQHLQQSVLCWWRCVLGETKATNYPPSPSQGQGWWVWRETSCRSLDLRGCASPFLCPGGSARYTQSDPDLNSGSRGKKERNLCKTTRGSHGIALLSHLTWAQRRFYKKRKKLDNRCENSCLALRDSPQIVAEQTTNIHRRLSSHPLQVTHQNIGYFFVLFCFL